MLYQRERDRPAAAAAPHIEIRGLTKRYGPLLALDAVDLAVGRGELFSLVGSSGCGKTTLLRALAGFVRPDSGEIRIGGRDMAPLEPYERPVNMMFQSYALFPHMSVESNVAFGLRREGLPGAEIRRRVGEALELTQMSGLARRRPHQLSGGQRQRVALARAVVKRPQVLLLDEPLSALDKKLRESTQLELASIQERLGITFVMVTHDQEEAMTMSTRIAVMAEGRIVQVGTPAEIYERPGNRLVAGFVGSVNLLEVVQVADTDGLATLRCEELGTLLVAPSIGAPTGAALGLGVRPERIAMAASGSTAGGGAAAGGAAGGAAEPPNSLEGRVASIGFLGDRRIYQVAVTLPGGESRLIKVTEANAGRGAPPFSRGQAVRIGWDADASMLLSQ
ncbi:MAG: ABC transporter ATP-binding protein [Dongiaceae bacterium]